MAPADLGRLRRRPDHRPGASRGRRHDDHAVARLRVPLGRRLRDGDGRHPRSLRPAARGRARGRPRAPERLRHVPVGLVQRRSDVARRFHRGLHARPHAAPVARGVGGPGRATRAVLRPAPARSRGDVGRVGRGRPRRPAAEPVQGPRGDRRRRFDVPLRRPPPVHEDGDAVHAHGTRAVPRGRRGHLAARRRAGPRGPGGRVAHGPADRHARPVAGQEPRLRGARLRDRPGLGLHDRPGGLPGRKADRAQDDPRQRPALDRRVHVPPERLRAGAAPGRPRRGGQAACGTRPCR